MRIAQNPVRNAIHDAARLAVQDQSLKKENKMQRISLGIRKKYSSLYIRMLRHFEAAHDLLRGTISGLGSGGLLKRQFW